MNPNSPLRNSSNVIASSCWSEKSPNWFLPSPCVRDERFKEIMNYCLTVTTKPRVYEEEPTTLSSLPLNTTRSAIVELRKTVQNPAPIKNWENFFFKATLFKISKIFFVFIFYAKVQYNLSIIIIPNFVDTLYQDLIVTKMYMYVYFINNNNLFIWLTFNMSIVTQSKVKLIW